MADARDVAGARARRPVGDPQHGDRERRVGLDGADHVARRRPFLADHAQEPVAALGQGGKDLERLERARKPASVTVASLARLALRDRLRRRRNLHCLALPLSRHRRVLATYRQAGAKVEAPLALGQAVQTSRASAASMRASVSSRPSAATDSNIPGETVVPEIATRTGWKTCLGLTPSRSTTSRSAASTPGSSNGSAAASAARASARFSSAPSPMTLSQA